MILGSLFLVLTLVGFYLAYLYGHKTKRFRWSEYLAIIVWPILFILFLAYYINIRILNFFVYSSIIGFFAEYTLGFIYFKVLNQKLWEYKRLSIGGYTSLLSIPLWGVGGVVFWFIGKLAGI